MVPSSFSSVLNSLGRQSGSWICCVITISHVSRPWFTGSFSSVSHRRLCLVNEILLKIV